MRSVPSLAPMSGCITQIRAFFRKHSLIFDDERLEQGFLSMRKLRLVRAIRIMSLAGLPLVAVLLVLLWFNTFSDDPKIAIFGKDKPEERKIMRFRGVVLLLICTLVVANAAIFMTPRLVKMMRPDYLEVYVIFWTTLAPPTLALTIPWYIGHVIGEDPGTTKIDLLKHEQKETMLTIYLDVLVTITHFFVPLRTCRIWAIGVGAWCTYLGFPTVLGSPSPPTTFWNSIFLGGLFSTAFWATRTLERLERENFRVVIAEREMRYQAQFRLDSILQESKPKKKRNADELSLATTTQTDVLWSSLFKGDTSEGLRALAQVGLDEHWLLAPSALEVGTDPVCLGAGSFGMVLAATYFGAPVAVKVTKQVQGLNLNHLASVAQELRVLRHVRHPFIVSLYGACIDPSSNDVVIVLERLFGTPLSTFFRTRFDQVGLETRVKLMKDVSGALQFMHNRHPRVVHGDLKGSNVLAEPTGSGPVAKLVDFGLSRLLTRSATPMGGTLKYMAPEVLVARRSGDFSLTPAPSADVFSYGRLLFLALTRQLPLAKEAPERIFHAAAAGIVVPLEWPATGPLIQEASELSGFCTHLDPAARLTMTDVSAIMATWLSDNRDTVEALTSTTDAESSDNRSKSKTQKSTLSLYDHLLRARAEELDKQLQQQQQQQQQQGGLLREAAAPQKAPALTSANTAGRPQLLNSAFAGTSNTSMELTLLNTMRSWNVHTNVWVQCCAYHDALQSLEQVRKRLLMKPCVDGFGPYSDWQCPDCLLMEGVDTVFFPNRSIACCRLCLRLSEVLVDPSNPSKEKFKDQSQPQDGEPSSSSHRLPSSPTPELLPSSHAAGRIALWQ